MLSVSRTVAAMLIAPFGAGAVYLAWAMTQEAFTQLDGALAVMVVVAAYSGAAGLILVLPVLLLVPSLRQPPHWVAALWGAGVAILFCLLLVGLRLFPLDIRPILLLASTGAAAGLTYSIAARALLRAQNR